MKVKKYLVESEKTLSINSSLDDKKIRLLHGAIGLVTESGELLDAFKKSIYYGKELDVVNVKEELGDIMWYFAIFLRELDLEFEDLLEINIEKLRTR
ncbi:nucleoside triphosphate pyrophosphohydrolase family protein, partial [Candidatus Dojkabacteria bacterium]|nr:nucleoside triphosphate pyrophosphohydrolase family protein [Candidatus Dojkabacteria bacterium]